jgi:DNA-binding NarL/FixJ family response regulator
MGNPGAEGHNPRVTARVLIVDDHAGFRAGARRLLELEGYVVVGEAESGALALEAALELRPDLVLLDLQLPDADGTEVCERLRERSERPTVVLTSVRERADFGPRVSRCGAAGFIPKAELSGDSLVALLDGADRSGENPA